MRHVDAEPFAPFPCPVCRGDGLQILGTLGDAVHFKCRYCGVECSARNVSETRAAVRRAADASAEIDNGNA
jgi:hypothetical protein